MVRAIDRRMLAPVVLVLFAAVAVLIVPPAQARWHHGRRWGHELDLSVQTPHGWIGRGLATRSDDPNDLVIRRSLGHDKRAGVNLRMQKFYELRRTARIRGCDPGGAMMLYEVDGVDVTDDLLDGGYRTDLLEPGTTEIRVVAIGGVGGVWCPIRVSSAGRVHDSLMIRFVR